MSDIKFDEIIPFFNGDGDSGKTARIKINGNFDKIKTWLDGFSNIDELFEKVNLGTADAPNYAIHAKFSLFSEGGITAYGKGSAGTGGSGSLDETLLWSILGNTGDEQIADNHLTKALSPYALVAAMPTKISQLENDRNFVNASIVDGYATESWCNSAFAAAAHTHNYLSKLVIGATSYDVASNTITIPAYPTTLPASDVSAWAKASAKPIYAFSEISSKPNTLVGYGITDAANINHDQVGTQTGVSDLIFSAVKAGVSYYSHYTGGSLGAYRAVLTAKDVGTGLQFNACWCCEAGTNPSDLKFRVKRDAGTDWSNYATIWHSGNFTNLNQLITRNFSDIQNKPTTLNGYGITDAAALSHSHTISQITDIANANVKHATDADNAKNADVAKNLAPDSTDWEKMMQKSVFDELFEKVNLGTADAPLYAIHAKYSLYSEGGITAYGKGSAGTGGSGSLDDTTLWGILSNTGDEQIAANHIATALTPYALAASLPTKLSQLNNDMGFVTASIVNGFATESWCNSAFAAATHTHNYLSKLVIGATSYDVASNTITIPAYPTTLPASDVSDWAKAATKPAYAFSEISGKPTTLNGYGITDAAAAAHKHAWADITDHPTTLPASDVYTWAKAATKPGYAFSEISSKPNTLAGYGITDAAALSHSHTIAQITDIANANVNHAITANNAGNADTLDSCHESAFLRFRGSLTDGTNALTGILTTGWSSTSSNYQTSYGDSLHIQGFSTWYNRLDFGTNGRIYFYQAINPSNLTACMQYKGTLAFLNDNVASATRLQTARKIAGVNFNGSEDISIPFANLSSIPTTLSGFGITDAANINHDQVGTQTGVSDLIFSAVKTGVSYYSHYTGGSLGAYRAVLTAKDVGTGLQFNAYWCCEAGTNPSDLKFRVKRDNGTDWSNYATIWHSGNFTNLNQLITRNFSDILNKPTTLAGYGITDAKIASGVIALGNNTITPLITHQTIYALTLQHNGINIDTYTPNGGAKTINIVTTTGTVTSVAMSVPTGFSISGTPITASGTLALAFASGYSLPTIENQAKWSTAYSNNHIHSNKAQLDAILSADITWLHTIMNHINYDGISDAVKVSSSLLATGGITAYTTSDKRLKKNIKQIDALQNIRNLGGIYQFDYKQDGKHSVGLIAQNVQASRYADMVYKRENGYFAVNYLDPRLISLSLGAIVQVDDEVTALKKRVRKLENKIKEMEDAA